MLDNLIPVVFILFFICFFNSSLPKEKLSFAQYNRDAIFYVTKEDLEEEEDI